MKVISVSTATIEYLELQAAISPEKADPGYTRLENGALVHYLEFLTAAILPGYGPYPAGSRLPIPVDPEVVLYFSDYGAPPAAGTPNPPVIVPIPHPPIVPVRPGPTGQFLASDGTVLAVQTTSGQVTGFAARGKDGHNYALTVECASRTAAGRVANTTASWLFVTMSMTDNGDTPLTFGFAYCPSDNLMNVSIGRGTVQTSILIDYSQSDIPGGTTKITRNLTYYGSSFMSQAAAFNAAQTNVGLYLAAGQPLWPFLNRVLFFGPAIQAMVNETAANLPKIPAGETPAVMVGSIGFGTYTPETLSQDSFVYSAVGTIGPALGFLAVTAIDPATAIGGVLGAAAAWLGWFALVPGEPSLSATLAADYSEWVAWFKKNQKVGQGHKPLPIPYPKDPKGHMITYHANPWAKKPPQDSLQPQQGQNNAGGNQQNQQGQPSPSTDASGQKAMATS
jgi:hypothetical protein